MGIRGLDHFSIPVSDTRRSLTFYEAIFGATVFEDEIGRYEFGFSDAWSMGALAVRSKPTQPPP